MMLDSQQLSNSNFKSELLSLAEERNGKIDKQLFNEDNYLLNFQYLPDSSAKPWNYFSIKQKMSKAQRALMVTLCANSTAPASN